MAASKKAIQNSNRLRYIRALERFHKGIVSFFNGQKEPTKEQFEKKVANGLKLLLRVEEVPLYKGDLQDLQNLVKKIIAYQQSDEDIHNIKEDILYRTNQLEKTKNNRRYKKAKHSKDFLKEWE